MVFGPGSNEAVIAARERIQLTAKDLSDPQAAQRIQSSGESISIVNLSTGAKRPVFLPRKDLVFGSLNWVSSRIIYAPARGIDLSGAVLIDTLTGRSHLFTNEPTAMVLQSGIPHIAALRSGASFGAETQAKSSLQLVDFSTTPPGFREIALPPQAANPLFLTKDRTLICRAGRDSFIELSLANGGTKPWQGDPTSLWIGEDGLEQTSKEAPLLLEAVIREGEQGGLWIMASGESHAARQGSPGRASAAKGSRTPSLYRPALRLSKDADFASLHSSGSRVLFRALGAAFCADLTPIDLETALELLAVHARTKALSYGKQAAIASLIYAADYDDSLPISGGQATDAVAPYIKDTSILERVVWTNLTGQNVAKIENPAEYQLGYVPGPGGRAVIYADGHIKWVPD